MQQCSMLSTPPCGTAKNLVSSSLLQSRRAGVISARELLLHARESSQRSNEQRPLQLLSSLAVLRRLELPFAQTKVGSSRRGWRHSNAMCGPGGDAALHHGPCSHRHIMAGLNIAWDAEDSTHRYPWGTTFPGIPTSASLPRVVLLLERVSGSTQLVAESAPLGDLLQALVLW